MKNSRFRVKNFKVYQDSKVFCKFCRSITERGIKEKDDALTNQIQRALNSIILNIAEGSADNSDIEFVRFLGISIKSVYDTVAGFDVALLHDLINDGFAKSPNAPLSLDGRGLR